MGTLSECNLVACSQLLAHPEKAVTRTSLMMHWLDECYGWRPDDETFTEFQTLLEQAGQVLYRAIYVRDHVFHRHSQVPESYGQGVWSLYGQLNRTTGCRALSVISPLARMMSPPQVAICR
jgi:hypothetical protein